MAWALPRLTPVGGHSGRTPLRLSDPDVLASIPRTFIHCTEFNHPFNGMRQFAEPIRRVPGWRYWEIATDHETMITHSRELSKLLLEVGAAMSPA